MTRKIEVLDHGYVELLNVAGPTRRPHQEFDAHDRDPANSARMSFGQNGERTLEEDMRLAKYLMKNWHTSPFEQVQIWLQMKLPIFVARQFVRHRTARLNEISGRYVQLPAEWYIPDHVGGKPDSNKQGQSPTLDSVTQAEFQSSLDDHCTEGYARYEAAIKSGVAAEHARMILALNHYTQWLWNQDLHNMMHLLSLRADSHAQIEAQAYAKAIEQLLTLVLPESMALYNEYRKKGV